METANEANMIQYLIGRVGSHDPTRQRKVGNKDRFLHSGRLRLWGKANPSQDVLFELSVCVFPLE